MKKMLSILVGVLAMQVLAVELLDRLSPAELKGMQCKIGFAADNSEKSIVMTSEARKILFVIILPDPIDLEGKTIKIVMSSQYPQNSPGISFEAANEKEIIWSFAIWNKFALAPTPTEYHFSYGRSRRLTWNDKLPKVSPGLKATRLNFKMWNQTPGVPIQLKIDRISVVDEIPEKDDPQIKYTPRGVEVETSINLPVKPPVRINSASDEKN